MEWTKENCQKLCDSLVASGLLRRPLPAEQMERWAVALEKRFWSKVRKSEGCWEWQASLKESGYGEVGIFNKTIKAHRLSWLLEHLEIPKYKAPDFISICHTCDNRSCVRPSHLFSGTLKENVNDMLTKGRMPLGEERGATKLSELQVREIFSLKGSGRHVSQALAKKFKVHNTHIHDIWKGKVWKFLNLIEGSK